MQRLMIYKFFDVALTDAKVNSLYSGTLATSDLSNIKNNISIYPNPAKILFCEI